MSLEFDKIISNFLMHYGKEINAYPMEFWHDKIWMQYERKDIIAMLLRIITTEQVLPKNPLPLMLTILRPKNKKLTSLALAASCAIPDKRRIMNCFTNIVLKYAKYGLINNKILFTLSKKDELSADDLDVLKVELRSYILQPHKLKTDYELLHLGKNRISILNPAQPPQKAKVSIDNIIIEIDLSSVTAYELASYINNYQCN
tara:strand:+ start:2569 stop:3174 length:606 start_codon:yes stop_codon:yes gene_type:complete